MIHAPVMDTIIMTAVMTAMYRGGLAIYRAVSPVVVKYTVNPDGLPLTARIT